MGFGSFVKSKYKQTNNLINQVSLLFILLGIAMIILNSINKNTTSSTTASDNTFKCTISSTNESKLTVEDLSTSYSISLIDYNKDVFKTDLQKNSIPALFSPKFVSINDVEKCLADNELALVVQKDDEVLVFPQKILMYHIAINTYIKDFPILVTYSPLADHYEVYSRNYKSTILEFGVSGVLYKNVDLLYDVSNESLWSQFNGKSLLGNYTGASLEKLSYKLLKIGDIKKQYNSFKVLSFDTGYMRNYDLDKFIDYRTDNTIVEPVVNNQTSFENKDLILGFNIDNVQYSVLESVITSNIAHYKDNNVNIEISKSNGDYIINNIASDGRHIVKDYTTAYAFVWYDFFPLTKKITLR